MGNQINQTYDIADSPPTLGNPIVKQLMATSPQQLQSILQYINHLQKLRHPNILPIEAVKVVKAHNFCSVISHVFVTFHQPRFTLSELRDKFEKEEIQLDIAELTRLVVGYAKGAQYLRKEGVQGNITEDLIYVDEQQNGELILKIINPYFTEKEEGINDKSLEEQLEDLFSRFNPAYDFKQMLILAEQLQSEKISCMQESRRARGGLKLAKHIRQSHYKSPARDQKQYQKMKQAGHLRSKERRQSKVSNTYSLLIDAGDGSHLMLKDLYEHFNDNMSDLSASYAGHSTCYDPQASHQFPKKYLRSKAFRKADKSTVSSNDWLSSFQNCSEWREQWGGKEGREQCKTGEMTREQSVRDNMGLDNPSLPSLIQK